MENVYHGSSVGNITKFEKRESTHGIPCVYACLSEVLALIYASKYHGDVFFQVGFDEKMIPFIVERKEGLLEQYYNITGYIYTLDGTSFYQYNYLWIGEAISISDDIKIINVRKVDNILSELYKNASEGKFTIYKYPSRPEWIPLDNSDLIDKYLDYYKKGSADALKVLLKFYPEFESEVFKRLAKM